MEILGPLIGLGPVILLVVLLLLTLRQMWSRDRSAGLWDLPSPGASATGVREPRRPLVPAGSAGAAIEPEMEVPVDDVAAAAARLTPTAAHDHGLRAS